MTLCPIALAVTCQKCFAFSVCPLKTVLGDHKEEAPKATPKAPAAKSRRKPGKSR
jgi:hypothetical protein